MEQAEQDGGSSQNRRCCEREHACGEEKPARTTRNRAMSGRRGGYGLRMRPTTHEMMTEGLVMALRECVDGNPKSCRPVLSPCARNAGR